MSVRNISLLITTIFVSVSCFAVNPLKPIITRQAAKGVEYTPREIVKSAKFQRPVVPVSSTRIHSLPSFDAKTALLSGEQALDFVVSRHSTSLYEELLDNLKSFEEADLSFSGSFVPSLQALREETQQYAREEFTTSPEQALQTMLDELPNSKEGYAIIKVAQRVPEEAEPRQTILVMDPQNLSWTVFTQTVQSTVVQAVLLDKFVPLLDEEGKEYLFVALEDTGSGKGIIVYNPSDIDNIRDAYASSDVNSYGQRIPREHPFYVRVVAFGNAVSPGLNVDPRITSVYPTYKLEYGATAHGPFFSTVSEVEAYLSEKEDRQRFLERDNQVSSTMQSSTTRYRVANDDDISYRFYKTFQEAEGAANATRFHRNARRK